jgi:UDP-glucose 4-epimerase
MHANRGRPTRTVLLGASGFAGAALASRLTAEGAAVLRPSSRALDLTDPASVERLAASLGPDVAVICTARVPRQPDAVRYLIDEVNLARHLALAVMRGGAGHVTYFSSTAVYGDDRSNTAITEETLPAPCSPYGLAKCLAEGVIRQAAAGAGVPLLVLRPCMIYGPGDRGLPYGPGRFIDSWLREGVIRVFGDGSERRDYLFIRDLVDITLALVSARSEGTFNLSSGRSHSFREIIACLERLSGQAIRTVTVPRDRPQTDVCLVPAALPRALPGLRFTPLEVGLRETWQAAAALARASA